MVASIAERHVNQDKSTQTMNSELILPEIDDVRQAARRIEKLVRHTQVVSATGLDNALGCKVFLKCDHLQPTGAFKLRGASNAIAVLRENGLEHDVATHSSGNHGAALAWAARADGRKAFVVMPRNAVQAKIDKVRSFGGQVVLCEPGQLAREQGMAEQVALGRHPIPPYDHDDIIAGQGTAALELFAEESELDDLVVPLGGGGLLAGCAIVAAEQSRPIRVYGAEPAGAADAAASLAQGERVTRWEPDTVADGLRALIGERNFAIIKDQTDDILLADDSAIESAMRLALDLAQMRIEPSAAVALAVIKAHPDHFSGRNVGVIITGANIDLDRYPWLRLPEI